MSVHEMRGIGDVLKRLDGAVRARHNGEPVGTCRVLKADLRELLYYFIRLDFSTSVKPATDLYMRGIRDGVQEAMQIATDQARLMADLAIEGLPENASYRDAMEAALTRFSQKLALTLEDLAGEKVWQNGL